ncbi:MAG TPA: NAD-dependent epimerase/dehydratase family protein [Puia sp.]|nr:NAD-dependent epimerase/dehydratase family protein [Puia sp.]
MIRWITDYVGTAAWEFAKAISDVEILDVRDLVDGIGNPDTLVEEKISLGVEAIQKQKKLIVCCEYGMSRSNAIAVGIICKVENITFNQGLKLVIESTKEDQIKLSVLKTVNKIVAKREPLKGKTRDKVLIIDYEDYIGRQLADQLNSRKALLLNKKPDFRELLSNPALFYLLAVENDIDRIVFVSCDGVINTNEFIGKLLFYLKNVLDVCIEADCDLVFISTFDIFLGYKKKTLAVKPGTIKNPHGNRGIAYSFAEDLIDNYRKNFKLNAAIIRIPVVYGKHTTKPYFITNFIRKAQAGAEIRIHRYKNNLAWVNLIHVNDLAKFIFQLIKRKQVGVYNIDGGERLNTSDISKSVIKAYSSDSKISFVELENDHIRINVNLGQIKRKFGWTPRENFYKTIKKQKHE